MPEALEALAADVNLTGRDHMTIWKSDDEGDSYEVLMTVDDGAVSVETRTHPTAGMPHPGSGNRSNSLIALIAQIA